MGTPLEELDTQRDYEDILRLQIHEGLSELQRSATGQFLSAFSCGLNLALGVFALFIVGSQLGAVFSDPVTQLFKGFVYTFGFVFAIMSQTELFTEHTSLALFPVFAGRASWKKLGQLWMVVWIGNLLGAGIFGIIGFYAGQWLHLTELNTFVSAASTFINLSPRGVFIGAVLAGWLMALLAWILTSVGDAVSRIAMIILITFLIGYSHLPHCVAANTELIAGILAGADITWLQWARFEMITTFGNIVGGVVFIGLLNYSFAIRGSGITDPEDEI